MILQVAIVRKDNHGVPEGQGSYEDDVRKREA